MADRVFKYELPIGDEAFIYMPKGAQVLTVQVQRREPCIWARVDDTQPPERRRFIVAGTGHRLFELGGYIGTFQLDGGNLVFHVFEPAP